jgi:hypothetical protein
MAKPDATDRMPQRTREHVIAAMGFIHVLKAFIDKGHTGDRPREDYGYDLIATTFDENGYEEDGDIRIQIKATDHLERVRGKGFLACEIERKHYNLWIKTDLPVFLIVFDAQEKRAYWRYVQAYFAEDPRRKPKAASKTVTVRIPIANEFSEDTVDYMRAKKTEILAQHGKASHHG